MADVNAPSDQTPTMAPPGIVTGANIDYVERIWEEFTQSINTFIEDKRNLSWHTSGIKRATVIVIPSVRFTKLIIHHLQRKHRFHPRPDSPLHLSNKEHVLGYLKFSAKGTKGQIFGMPIPSRIITENIRAAPYYQEYQENVAKHIGFLAGETRSTQDLPAPRPAKPARKPQSTTQKAPPKPSSSSPVTSTQPAPTSVPTKTQENKRKGSPKSVGESEAEEVPVEEPQVADEDADFQKAMEESMKDAYALPKGPLPPVVIGEPESGKYQPLPEVPGKGKAKVSKEQVAHDLLSLQKHKKSSPADQYIFQSRVSKTTASSFHDVSSYEVLGQLDREEESEKVVLRVKKGSQDEGQAGLDPNAQDEGQTRSDTGAQAEGQAGSNPKETSEGQAGSNPDETSEGQARPDPGNAEARVQSTSSPMVYAGSDRKHMDIDVANVSLQPSTEQLYEGFTAKIYPNVQENLKLAIEEPVLLEEPASSSGTLSSLQHLSRDFTFGDQFFSDKPSDADKSAKTEVKSMERLDKHGARLYTLDQLDIPQQVSTAVSKVVTDAVDWAMQAPLRNRFKDLPEADLKEILHQRITSGTPRAFGSQVTLPPPPPTSINQDNPSTGLVTPSPVKTAATTKHQAWSTPDITLKPLVSLTPEDLDRDEAMDKAGGNLLKKNDLPLQNLLGQFDHLMCPSYRITGHQLWHLTIHPLLKTRYMRRLVTLPPLWTVHLNHLPPKDKKILTTAVNQWTRQLVIRQHVEDFQLGIESYQTQVNLTKPQWTATGFEYKHDYTVIESPRAVIFRDKYGVQMMMRFNEIHKFNDGTLQQIVEALDYRVKEFRINRMNLGLNTMFWTKKDVDRCNAFMFAIQRRLRTRRIFRNLESFVGGRVREGDYILLKRIPTVAAAGQKDVNLQLHTHFSNLSSMNSKKTYHTAFVTLMYAVMIQDRVIPTNSSSTMTTDTTSGEAGTKLGRTVTLTAENMQKKKNDVKERTTLLQSLPDEHQLRFKGSETLEQMFNRLQVIIGQLQFMDIEIEQDDLNQMFLTSLALEWLMHTIVWRNRSDLDTMSLDNLYNHLKVYETEVQKKLEPNSQNMAFISSAKHSSRNEDGNTACVPTASTNVPTASASVATISQDTAYAYIASQSSDKFWKKTEKKISIQGSDVAGFGKLKVECFNCHKMGHFSRECRAPRNQDRGRRDNYRHGSKAEEQAPKALMAIGEVGWDGVIWQMMKKIMHWLLMKLLLQNLP
nr:hypothetical protein [Tanacetum cinerariifolium]